MAPAAARDGSAVYSTADDAGHSPAWRVDLGTGEVTRLTRSGAYTDLCPSADGRYIYALRNHVDGPPRPVRADAKLLYFPDEGHWIAKPGNVKIWYETVTAFLDHHVLGAAWTRPPML
jgi:dipeptidyl aminopeptidase/acylaminoacyl peptidase